jgi:hypothetical protein
LLLVSLPTEAGKTDSSLPPGAEKVATISATLPFASIHRPTAPKSHGFHAQAGMDLTWSDVVKTDRYGRARIRMNDGSLLSIGVHSELRITPHDPQSHKTSIELAYGLLRAQIQKLAAGETFEVRTPTAVAGVIGTDFGIDASDPKHVKFFCLQGTVRITSLDPAHSSEIDCNGGDGITLDKTKLPQSPTALKPEQISRWRHVTDPDFPQVE